jgi:hypothetical protein
MLLVEEVLRIIDNQQIDLQEAEVQQTILIEELQIKPTIITEKTVQ